MNRDAFPSLSELPAMIVAYALLPVTAWAYFRNPDYRAFVFGIVSQPGFWMLICAGLAVFVLATAYLYYREWKEPLT